MKIQVVPDTEKLWRAINKPEQVYKDTGRPKPAFFRDKTGLSCDLARFSTPERSRIGHGEKPYPAESGLVEFETQMVRTAGADVRHAPVKEPRRNYAHAQIESLLSAAGQEAMSKLARYRVNQSFK